MASEVVAARGLAMRLFLRDFRARFRQSIGGTAWALLQPAITVAGFVLMRMSGVLSFGEVTVPYPLYALLGFLSWQVFAGVLTKSTQAVAIAGEMVRRISFPREALVIGAAGHAVVDFLVQSVLLLAVFALYGIMPPPAILLVPLALLPLFLIALGIGMVLSALNAIVRDISMLVSVAVNFLVLATPVFYPRPDSGPLATVMRWNPLSPSIEAARDLAFQGGVLAYGPLLWTAVLSVALFLVCWRLFHHLEPLIAERL